MKIIGRYELIEEIGRGGMAVVYRARDGRLEREVGLKLLAAHLGGDAAFAAQFEQEAQIVAKLNHPHIVPIYDVGVDDNRPFLVMRLLRGGTLRDKLAAPTFQLAELWPIINQLAQALDYAHQQGVVHRDIKPTNILFDGQGTPFLSDFGIAKESEATRRLSKEHMLGTPAYMSPEQFQRDGELNGRSDQYSLAVVVYEAVVGRPPFSGDTLRMMYQHVNESPPLANVQNTAVSHQLATVLKKALAKKPEQRFPTVAAFAQQLQRAASSPVSRQQRRHSGFSTVVQQEYERGQAAMAQKDWQTAVSAFNSVVRHDRQYRDALRLRQTAQVRLQSERRAAKQQARQSSTQPRSAKPATKEIVAGAGGVAEVAERSKSRIIWAIVAMLLLGVVGLLAWGALNNGGKTAVSAGTEPTALPIATATERPTATPTSLPRTEQPTLVATAQPLPTLVQGLALTVVEEGEGARWRTNDSESILGARRRLVLTAAPLTLLGGETFSQIQLPDETQLFLPPGSEIVLTMAADSKAIGLLLKKGHLLVVGGAMETAVFNPFGAQAATTGGIMGVLLQPDSFRFEAHCLDGNCQLVGETEDIVHLSRGQLSWVGGNGRPHSIVAANYELFAAMGVEAVPTPTPTPSPTHTRVPPSPTSTRRPATAVPTATITPEPDADGDGVLGAADVCPEWPGPAENNGCPEQNDDAQEEPTAQPPPAEPEPTVYP